MNSTTPAAEMVAVTSPDELANAAFRWLLVLGFPPAVAAATVRPEIFRCDETTSEPKAA